MALQLLAAAFLRLGIVEAEGHAVEFKVVDTNGRPVADAVVSLVPLDASPTSVTSPADVEIGQKGQEFSPYVTAVRVGTPVVFPNHDTVQHHIYSLSPPKKFEFPLYQPGEAKRLVFDQPGVVVLGCNIHDWMSAYLVVLETPWFGRTSAAGQAVITDMPAGRYRAEVWHPRLAKSETRAVSLDDSTPTAPLTFALTLKPDRRIKRAPEAGRGRYE